MNPGLYWRTMRHLRPGQVWHQVLRRMWAAGRPMAVPRGVVCEIPKLIAGCERRGRYVGPDCFRFLNEQVAFPDGVDWVSADRPLLWRYNLHYFEYLADPDLSREDGERLMLDWIERHPYSAEATGWKPYPLSLRIVFWIRWLAAGDGAVEERIAESLWRQLDSLSRQVEWHILGNHLFVNGKALLIGGVVFGEERWVRLGRRILSGQIAEQFLADGGQFELSPMYHALAVEDLLDLMNLERSCGGLDVVPAGVGARALGWLRAVAAGGAFPLLNDAGNGIAASMGELDAYAERLDVVAVSPPDVPMEHGWRRVSCSGLLVLRRGGSRLIFDTAAIGPDYLPGHAHCDMLGVLFDCEGRAVFTDTGVFEYTESERRRYSRSTLAHNTVSIDGLEQAEIWKSFRVGRRGYPVDFAADGLGVRCGHSGFAAIRRGLAHHRRVEPGEAGFTIEDELSGAGGHSFRGRWHVAPGMGVEERGANVFSIGGLVEVEIVGAKVRLIETEFYPEYGIVERRPCLEFFGEFDGTARIQTKCTFFS